MNAPAYPFSRTLRKSSVTSGNGVTTVWGPSSFKIADVLDVEVWRKDLGDDDFSPAAASVAKTGDGFSTFTVTISPALPATSQFYYKSKRLHERSVAITKTAQKLDPDALDYELTKLGTIQQEHYRDIAEVLSQAEAAVDLANEAIELAQSLGAAELSEGEDADEGTDKLLTLKAPGLIRYLTLPYIDLEGNKGAVIGGHGGTWAWLQQSIWDAQERGKPVHAGPRLYDFGEDAAEITIGDGNISIVGTYGQTIFSLHEGTALSPKSLIKDTTNSATKGFLNFHGLTFRGTFGEAGREAGNNVTGQIFLDHYKEIRFSYCRWENIFTMATDCHFNKAMSWDHCSFIDIAGDGARARESFYTSVTNCYFRRLGDDAVAYHGGKYVDGYDPDDGSPRREGLIVSGNIFADVSAPITALGARQVLVSGNIANRYRTYFFYTDLNTAEGVNPTQSVKITNNVALNIITDSGSCIVLGAPNPRATAQSDGIYPSNPKGDGTFEYSWDYQNANSQDAADAFPPLEFVDISGNTFARTLPTVSNYTDWGYGYPASPTWQSDLALTEDRLRPVNGISAVIGRVTTIKNNILVHADSGVVLINQSNIRPAAIGGDISGNTIHDFTIYGIRLIGASGILANVKIHDNDLDGDRYRLSANSNADGTYDGGFAEPTALGLGSSVGTQIHDNRIANVARIHDTTIANHKSHDNVVICDPVALGSDAGNKGVRNIPAPEEGFLVIPTHCDPTDVANYGNARNAQVQSANACPSSGVYVRGHIVWNTGFSVTGTSPDEFFVLGWKRRTTGSGHVMETDWMEMQIRTGT